jgi:hypothetical protein
VVEPSLLGHIYNLTDPFNGPMRMSRHWQLLAMSVERT